MSWLLRIGFHAPPTRAARNESLRTALGVRSTLLVREKETSEKTLNFRGRSWFFKMIWAPKLSSPESLVVSSSGNAVPFASTELVPGGV